VLWLLLRGSDHVLYIFIRKDKTSQVYDILVLTPILVIPVKGI
jgi:hypothetical protein